MNKQITIIGGAYGSGKTEFALAYAIKMHDEGYKVGLVDLDIVNPYFRSRDRGPELSKRGLTVASTEPGLENSDLPALSPRIYGLLQDPGYQQVIVDVGGDPAGARALGRFYPFFSKESYQFWILLNPFRPGTRKEEETLILLRQLEQTSRLRISGIISNINLGSETTVDLWRQGLPLVETVAADLDVPVITHMLTDGFYRSYEHQFQGYPIFPVELQMRPPWLVK